MISRLSIKNFRNISDFSQDSLQNIVLILGPNGAGKTNILDAVAMLSSRSRRKNTDNIAWGEESALLEFEIAHKDQLPQTVRVGLRKSTTNYILHEKSVSHGAVKPLQPIMSFYPNQVTLFSGEPSLRRSFFDEALGVIDPLYADHLAQYEKVLKNRNALLKKGKFVQEQEFDVWEEALARHAAYITPTRFAFAEELTDSIKETMSVVYVPSPQSLREYCASHDTDAIQDFFHHKLRELREKEKIVGFTLIGPQRDDWRVLVPFDVGSYGSRGQQRLAVLEIQLVLLDRIATHSEVAPIWMLDDVFSELDMHHQDMLQEYIRRYQTFITGTNESYSGISSLVSADGVTVITL